MLILIFIVATRVDLEKWNSGPASVSTLLSRLTSPLKTGGISCWNTKLWSSAL